MQIPDLGMVIKDNDLGWYHSAPVTVAALDGTACRFVIDGYDDDPAQEDFHAAIRTFLALDRSALDAAASSIYAYYRDVTDGVLADGDDESYVEIEGPHHVLDHVRPGTNRQSAAIAAATSTSTSRSSANATGNQSTVCRSCSGTAPR